MWRRKPTFATHRAAAAAAIPPAVVAITERSVFFWKLETRNWQLPYEFTEN
ncbi:MAG: hypothetical protein K8L97_24640 [Anaerolineae bacterium]|nr:hypothetical protein [Anaerolineae bacterium]